jgi:hypothetical protein
VVANEVEGGAHGQAEDAADEEAGEDDDVLSRGGAVERFEVREEQPGRDEEGDGAEKMAVDVDGLIV